MQRKGHRIFPSFIYLFNGLLLGERASWESTCQIPTDGSGCQSYNRSGQHLCVWGNCVMQQRYEVKSFWHHIKRCQWQCHASDCRTLCRRKTGVSLFSGQGESSFVWVFGTPHCASLDFMADWRRFPFQAPCLLVTESRLDFRPGEIRSKLWRGLCNANLVDFIQTQADRFYLPPMYVVDVIIFHL